LAVVVDVYDVQRAGRTLPPIIPASRNELGMEELSFIPK
jgi:hypothetical protein